MIDGRRWHLPPDLRERRAEKDRDGGCTAGYPLQLFRVHQRV